MKLGNLGLQVNGLEHTFLDLAMPYSFSVIQYLQGFLLKNNAFLEPANELDSSLRQKIDFS